ncbi:hypothetical protein [Nostoc sp. ChiSLP03a]|uniref:hypothetical protein n=1 Tax=Nostoc sp. ChiSLP03a TaxID=3075380 RepID=UPI00391D7741
MKLLNFRDFNWYSLTRGDRRLKVAYQVLSVSFCMDAHFTPSRRTMREALNAIAQLLTNSSCDASTLDWSKLGYQHTSFFRLCEKLGKRSRNPNQQKLSQRQ